jgi:O-acetyl-ADP-ribose deacetylase
MRFKNTEIEILEEDLTDLDVEVIVNPANSHGLMGGGVARSIRIKVAVR